MKSSGPNLVYLTGDVAYMVYWEAIYHFRIKLSTLKLTDTNLEIIVNPDGDLLAYRYDCHPELKNVVKDEGEWNLFHEEKLSASEKEELEEMIKNLNIVRLNRNKEI